jgi:hypothetical protein
MKKRLVFRDGLKRYGLVLFFVWGLLPLWGETYRPLSPEVTELRYLYRRASRAFPFFSYPVHGSDLLRAAEDLEGRLRGADVDSLDRIIQDLSVHKRGIFLRGASSLSYVHRLRSGGVLLDPGTVKNAQDFRRAYLSLPPFFTLSAAGGTFTGLFLEAAAGQRDAWTEDYKPDNNFVLPASKVEFASDVFATGIIAWNGTYIDTFFGRDNLHFGETPGASLYPSREVPYLDGLRISILFRHFSMDYLLSTIQPKKAPYDITDAEPNAFKGKDGREYFGFMTDPDPSIIMTALHHFGWNFGPVKAGVGATVVYARSNNMFTFTDIIPISSWHNADMRPNNMNIIFELNWAFYPGFALTGMFGFDDINLNNIGVSDSGTPTIPAGIFQAEYGRRGEHLNADFLLEAGYTHYLWGNFSYATDDTWGGAPLARAIYRYAPNKEAVLLPLTSPYGPGTIWGRLVSSLTFPRFNAKVSADLLVLTKNRDVNLIDTLYDSSDPTHHSPRIWYVSLDLPGVYTWRWFEFSLAPALIIRNKKAVFECSLGLKFVLGGQTYFKTAKTDVP